MRGEYNFLNVYEETWDEKNRGGGGVLNLTSTTTVAMNKIEMMSQAIDETFDKDEV